jgi:hypothetical protein
MTTRDSALLALLPACTGLPIRNRAIANFALERRVTRAGLEPLVPFVRGLADIGTPDPEFSREPDEVLVNQRTAWAFGIIVPRSVLAQAAGVVH